MKNFLISLIIGGAVVVGGISAAHADVFKGPHEVLHYKQSRYIAVPFTGSDGTTLRFYRAHGPFWQKWGATFINDGQRLSDGSIRQNIFFDGRSDGLLRIDLRNRANLFFGGRRG